MTTPRDPTAPRNPDQLIHAFLDEGPMDLREEVLDEVRSEVDRTEQRTRFGQWTSRTTARFAGFAAVTSVVGALIVGLAVTGGGPFLGGAPSVSPTAHPSVEPTPGPLPEGPFVLVYEMLFGVRTTVTIPAPDWYGLQYETFLAKHGGAEPPLDARLRVFGGNLFVYGDPCAWESTRPDAPAASLDELVAALTAQASRNATDSSDVTVGGYPGKRVGLQVPEDADFADCDAGEFRTLVEVSSSGNEAPLTYEGPGQLSEVWVVDVDGTLVYFEASHFEGTPTEYFEEMVFMVDSATFE